MSATIRRQPIVNRVPAQIDFKLQNITNFGGIIQQDNPLKLSINTASDMKNLYVDDYGALTTRPRTELLTDFGIAVKQAIVVDELMLILDDDNKLYKQNSPLATTLTLIQPMDSSVIITELKGGFKYNDSIFINGNDLFFIDSNNKLNFVYNSSQVYTPYLKRGMVMGDDISAFPDNEPYNILSPKYKISYYWDGLTDFNILENGTVVENNNLVYKDIPDLRASYEDIQYLPNGYILQYGPTDAFLLKQQSDLTYEHFNINIPTVSNYITKVTMRTDMTKYAVADDNGNRLRIFGYDLETNTSTWLYDVFTSGHTINYYAPMKFCCTTTNLAFWSNNGIFYTDYIHPVNPPVLVLAGVTPQLAIGSDLLWNNDELYTLTSFGFRSYNVAGSVTLTKEIAYYNSYSIMNVNADRSKIVLANAFYANGRIMVMNTADWSVIIDTYNTPIVNGVAFDEADSLYMVYENGIYVMSFDVNKYLEYYVLKPNIGTPSSYNGFYVMVANGLIWNYMRIAYYVETAEPGVVVEYSYKDHIEIFTQNAPTNIATISFTNNAANYETYDKNYYLKNASIGFVVSGSRISFPIDINTKGVFSYSFLTAYGNYLFVYEVDDYEIRLLSSSILPAYPTNLSFEYYKPILNFRVIKQLFNKYHFAYKNRDYFQNNTRELLYVPDYNICGDDSHIYDYGVLNANYALILKQKESLLLTINNDGLETYINLTGHIGTDYSTSITTQYNNLFIFGNKTGLFNLSELSNISVFSQKTRNLTETIYKTFSKISNKNKLLTQTDSIHAYFIYPGTTSSVFVLDERINQWFYWEIKDEIIETVVINDILYYLSKSGKFLRFTTTDLLNEYNPEVTEYYDHGKQIIDWYWKSQITPMNNINKYKQLYKTSFIVTDTDALDEFGLNYKFRIFRKFVSESSEETTTQSLNLIKTTTLRTFVNRFNFIQLEFYNIPDALEHNKLRLVGLNFTYRLMEGII